MAETTYNDPNLSLSRIYTKGGDQGQTSLVNGRRVGKDDPKVAAYGDVDELNAFIGQARISAEELGATHPAMKAFGLTLLRVQHELFNLGSILATDAGTAHPQQPRVSESDVLALERDLDEKNAGLPKLKSFVLPGGCRLNAELHVCRTVCRRAERAVVGLGRREELEPWAVRYLNRLSDALFVWSRWACVEIGVAETVWQPNEAASGKG